MHISVYGIRSDRPPLQLQDAPCSQAWLMSPTNCLLAALVFSLQHCGTVLVPWRADRKAYHSDDAVCSGEMHNNPGKWDLAPCFPIPRDCHYVFATEERLCGQCHSYHCTEMLDALRSEGGRYQSRRRHGIFSVDLILSAVTFHVYSETSICRYRRGS
jgi:hypothetical protein